MPLIDAIWQKIETGIDLSKEDALTLLSIPNTSEEFYRLIAKANALSRTQYNNRGYIFAQIGINAAPCSGNCRFCSLARDYFSVDGRFEKDAEQVVAEARAIADQDVDALFLMTTADFDQDTFVSIGRSVRAVMPDRMELVANIGDFDLPYARKLKTAGFTSAYHIVRLREGMDTMIPKENRIATIDAVKAAGLDLYYCIEPIGPEHTYDEIADEMIRARAYQVDVMAVMGRVNVDGTAFADPSELTEPELTKIAAVTRLVTNPKKSMNIHEPRNLPLLAGVNQLYAEFGANPRDNHVKTEDNRGYGIERVKKMLREAEYTINPSER